MSGKNQGVLYSAKVYNRSIDNHQFSGQKLPTTKPMVKDCFRHIKKQDVTNPLKGFPNIFSACNLQELALNSFPNSEKPQFSLFETCFQLFVQITIDDIEIERLNLKWLREQIGLVSQEPVLFGCSIKENIEYGRSGVTDEEIEKAIDDANAREFINKLPDVKCF